MSIARIVRPLFTILSDRFDRLRANAARALVKFDLSQDLPFILLAVLVGLGAGYGAYLYHQAIEFVRIALFVDLNSLGGSSAFAPYLIMFFPAIGGLLVGIILHFVSPEARGHGVPDVIKAVIAKGGYIKSSLLLPKIATSALSIGSGGGAGREGPIVQIGATVGSAVGQFFRLSTDHVRTLVAAGSAGGIAAIFNAPIGGVMFALEVIIGEFSIRRFSPIVVSSVVATAVARSLLGNHPTFVSTHYQLVSNSELVFYVLLGLMAGVISVWFTRAVFWAEDLFAKIRRVPRILQPALGGLGVGVMLIWFPSLAGFSYDINNQAILGQADVLVLLAVFLLKPVATGLTLGSGGSGGVFAPALKAGAAFGGIVGVFLHWAFPQSTATSGAYALVGMGALLAGTMHAPLTAIIMLFEVSDTYQVILPIMFAAVASVTVAKIFLKQSIYTLPLEREGIEVAYGINLSIVHRFPITALVNHDSLTVVRTASIRHVLALFENHEQDILPVLDGNQGLIGIIRFQDCRPVYAQPHMQDTMVAEDIMTKNAPIVEEKESLDEVLKLFELVDVDTLPVVNDEAQRTYVGLIRHEDVLRRYRREVLMRSER